MRFVDVVLLIFDEGSSSIFSHGWANAGATYCNWKAKQTLQSIYDSNDEVVVMIRFAFLEFVL